MRKYLTAAMLIVLGIMIHASVARGRGRKSSFAGSVTVGRTQTIFSMPGGYTSLGKLGSPRKFSDVREHRFVPEYYGDLIAVTAQGDHAVLWYRDRSDNVRNLLAPSPDGRLYLFEKQASTVSKVNH